MEINSINRGPSFRARIVIQKTGFENLGKDIADSFKSGGRMTVSATGGTSMSTLLPCECVYDFPNTKRLLNFTKKIGEYFNNIFHRNIKTTTLEGVDSKVVAEKTASVSTGSGMMSTGIESYDFAVASAIDQSANYPNSVFSPKFPEFSANHFPQSVNDHLESMERIAYDRLWDPRRGFGNECASSSVPTYVGLGSVSQSLGFGILTKGKHFLEDGTRAFPS